MKKWLSLCILVAWPLGLALAQERSDAPEAKVRFQTVDIYVDPQDQPLAAYQLEVSVEGVTALIAGVEGGGHPAFKEPPFYDLKALRRNRLIIAAFSTLRASRLPDGRTRVATLHFQISGSSQPRYRAALKTAGSTDGRKIHATVTLEERNTHEDKSDWE